MSVYPQNSNELLEALKIMGVDISETKKVTIHIAADEAIMIEVLSFANKKGLDGLATVLKKYELKEIKTKEE